MKSLGTKTNKQNTFSSGPDGSCLSKNNNNIDSRRNFDFDNDYNPAHRNMYGPDDVSPENSPLLRPVKPNLYPSSSPPGASLNERYKHCAGSFDQAA